MKKIEFDNFLVQMSCSYDLSLQLGLRCNTIEKIIKMDPETIMVYYNDGTIYEYVPFLNSKRKIIYNKNVRLTDKETKYEFTRNLKKWMKIRFFSQKELADKIGVTKSTINRYITGERLPSVFLTKKIVDALQIKFEYLFYNVF